MSVKNVEKLEKNQVVLTVEVGSEDFEAAIDAGVSIFNISAAENTAELVKKVRSLYPTFPIIATGGPTAETILKTIRAGANVISYTPPTTAEFFKEIMTKYRNE